LAIGCKESEGVTGSRFSCTVTPFLFNGGKMTKTISDLEINDVAKVSGYSKAGKPFINRLLSMGLTKGTELKVVRVAPLGDPIEINLRGFNLSLRKSEAEAVFVERS
jgi:ferrous iron transport protein A